MARAILLITLTVLCAATLTFSVKQGSGDDIACQQNVMGQLDHYLKEIELVPNSNNPKIRFPETIASLKEACKINKNIMTILTKLADKCMTGFKKNVMQVTLYSVKRSQKTLCRNKPTKEMRDFVAAGKCVNGGRDNFRKCFHQTTDNILKVKAVEDNMKIPYLCCQVVRTRQCLMKEAKKVKECKDEHVETINSRFNHVSMNTLNLACGQYTDETDRCNKVQPPKGVVVDRGNKSMVISMFELLDSLPLSEENLSVGSK